MHVCVCVSRQSCVCMCAGICSACDRTINSLRRQGSQIELSTVCEDRVAKSCHSCFQKGPCRTFCFFWPDEFVSVASALPSRLFSSSLPLCDRVVVSLVSRTKYVCRMTLGCAYECVLCNICPVEVCVQAHALPCAPSSMCSLMQSPPEM